MTGFDIWNELGNIYFKVGAFDEAIDAYNKAIELDFRIGWLYSNLGFAYVHKGKFAEAIPMYEKSIELLTDDKDKALSWSRLGDAYRELRQYDCAVQAYERALELDPADVSFSAGLNAVREQMSPVDQEAAPDLAGTDALDEPEQPEAPMLALDIFPDDEQQDAELPVADEDEEQEVLPAGAFSSIFAADGIPEPLFTAETIVRAEAAVTVAETAKPAAETMAVETQTLEVSQPVLEVAAVQEFQPALDLMADLPTRPEPPAPQDTESAVLEPHAAAPLEQDALTTAAFNSLLASGIECWRKGNPEKACETLQSALDAARKADNRWLEALSYNALALVKTELGKLEEAIDSYIQAMQLAPEKIIPWNNIGSLYSKLDRNDEAMSAFLKAIEHNPEDFVGWDGLGDIYAKCGRFNDAIAAYQLGNVFGKQRRVGDALTAYQMILEPERDEVLEMPEDSVWIPEVPEAVEPAKEEQLVEPEPVAALAEMPLEVLPVAEAALVTDVDDATPAVDGLAETFVPAQALLEAVESAVSAETAQPVETVFDEVSAGIDTSAPQASILVDEPILALETPIVPEAAAEPLVAPSEAVAQPVVQIATPAPEETVLVDETATAEMPAAPEMAAGPLTTAETAASAATLQTIENALDEIVVELAMPASEEVILLDVSVAVEAPAVPEMAAEPAPAAEIAANNELIQPVEIAAPDSEVTLPVVETAPLAETLAAPEMAAEPLPATEISLSDETIQAVASAIDVVVEIETPVLEETALANETVAAGPAAVAEMAAEPLPAAEFAPSEGTVHAIESAIDDVMVASAAPEPLVSLPTDEMASDEIMLEPVAENTVAPEAVADEQPVAVETAGDRIRAEMSESLPEPLEAVAPPVELIAGLEPVEDAVAEEQSLPTSVEIIEERVVEEVCLSAPEAGVLVEEIRTQETILLSQGADSDHLPENASSSIEMRRLASAIAAYKKVTEINPENDRAWDSLGNLYRASEHYEEAVAAFERAISLHPDKEVYHYHLGLVYAAEKKYEDAIGAFQVVIHLNPDYTFAHCALAGYFRKVGKEAEAQQHIAIAQPKMAGEKEYDRACFAAICGNTDEAVALLKIALEKKQTSLDWVRRDPDLDFVRDDPRFKAIVGHNGSWSERLSEVFTKQLAWSANK